MFFSITVEGRTPRRTDPHQCADRFSPGAGPLARIGLEVAASDTRRFPLSEYFGLTLITPEEVPEYEGYEVDSAVIEVLVDVGVIADERQQRWFDPEIDPTLGNFYVVTISPEYDEEQGASGTPVHLSW